MKKFVSLLLCLAMVLSLAACGAKAPAAETEAKQDAPAAQAPAQEAPEKEVVIHWADQWTNAIDSFDVMVQEFVVDKPNVTLEIEHATSDFATLMMTKLNAGELPDIFGIEAGTKTEQFAEYAYDWSNDTEVLALFHEDALERCKDSQGRIVGLPYCYETTGMIYSVQAFEKAGIEKLPVNMEELEEVCEKLDTAGIAPFGIWANANWVTTQMATHFIIDKSLGGKGTNDALLSGELKFADLPNFQNLFKLLDLIAKYNVTHPLEYESSKAYNALANGEIGMVSLGAWCQASLDKYNPDNVVKYMPMPVGETAEDCTVLSASNQCFMVNKDSENLELAKEFLVWVMSGDTGLTWFAEVQGMAPAAINDKEIKGILPNSAKAYIDAGVTNDWIHTIAPAAYTDTCGGAMQAYLIGEMTAEEVTQVFQDVWDAAE